MKKVCFMIACLLIISNTPSFAAKIIVNDTNSRIVHSRSTSHYESDLDAAYHAQKGIRQVEEEQNFEEIVQEEQPEEVVQEEPQEEFQEENHEEVAQEEPQEEFQEENHEEVAQEEPVNYVKRELSHEEISNLSSDFRNELIGTYWNYAETDAQRAYEEQMAMEQARIEEEQRMLEEQRAMEEQMAMEQARMEEEQRMLEEQRAMEEQMALEQARMEEEQAQEHQPEEEIAQEPPREEPVQEEIADINEEYNSYLIRKRGSREAADYYMIDSIKDPNVAIPSGFPQ